MKPLGNEGLQWVKAGNLMLIRVTLACFLHWLNDQPWTLETSVSSTMSYVVCFKMLLAVTCARRYVHWLGFWGAPTPKGVKLYSTAPWLQNMPRSHRVGTDTLTTWTTRDDGSKAVTGKKEELQGSEHYPYEFGQALFRAMMAGSGCA